MKTRATVGGLVVLGMLVTCAVTRAATIAEWGFERGTGGWAKVDPRAKVSLASGKGFAVEGTSSLHVSYTRPASAQDLQQPGPAVGAIGAELEKPLTDQTRCLEFAIRSKTVAVLIVSLTERDGSNYQRLILLPANRWERVKLYLKDFTLAGNSQDENGRLDAQQIRTVALLDAYGLFMLMRQRARKTDFELPGLPGGPNEIWLDAVRFTDEQAPPKTAVEDAATDSPMFVALLGPKMQVDRTQDGPGGKPAWVLSYSLAGRQFGVMVWPVRDGLFADAMGVHVVLSAENATALLVQVKERNGARYNCMVRLQPGEVVDKLLPWTDFTLDGPSMDDNGRLDADQIVELTMVDVSTRLIVAPHDNKLTVALIAPAR